MPFDNFFFFVFFSFKENGVSLFGIFFCCMLVYCTLLVSVFTHKLQMLTHVTVKYIYLALPSKTMDFFCRLRASLLECVGGRQPTFLSTSYEDILKKDPTCSHSLADCTKMVDTLSKVKFVTWFHETYELISWSACYYAAIRLFVALCF